MRRNEPCRSCLYASRDGYCTYLLWTLHRRPCPPGQDCTVYERASDEQRKKAKNNIIIMPATTAPKPPKPSRRIWDTAKALRMYQDGASDVQIAKACRVSPTTIYLWRKGQGLPTHAKPSRRIWDTAKAMQMYQDDASDRQIAKALGVCPTTIGEWREKEGLPPRHMKKEKKLVGAVAERALRMYQEGATDAQIAKACGVANSSIRRWREREGMSRPARGRTKGGAR